MGRLLSGPLTAVNEFHRHKIIKKIIGMEAARNSAAASIRP
jgi:hypothetical protein